MLLEVAVYWIVLFSYKSLWSPKFLVVSFFEFQVIVPAESLWVTWVWLIVAGDLWLCSGSSSSLQISCWGCLVCPWGGHFMVLNVLSVLVQQYLNSSWSIECWLSVYSLLCVCKFYLLVCTMSSINITIERVVRHCRMHFTVCCLQGFS